MQKLSPWQRFIKLLNLERKDIFQIFYYAIFSGLVALSLPLGIQAIVNLIQGAQISTSWIILIFLVCVGVIFTGILQLMQLRIIETIQQRIFVRSSFELSYRFPNMKNAFLRKHYPPELANRFFDTLTVQKGISKVLIDVPAALLQIAFALTLLSFYHPFFIMFGFILIAAVYFVFKYSVKRGIQTSLQESKFKYRVAHWIQEIARSPMSFKISGPHSIALNKTDKLVSQYLNARENHFSIIKLQYIKMIAFKTLITASLLITGGILVLNQKMNIGQFVAAEIIILLVINSVEKLIIGLETIYDMLTSIEKIGQLTDFPLEKNGGQTLDYSNGISIKLENIDLKVPERDVFILKSINLSITKNERLLIKGRSGSGKSSLLKIISGITEPSSGQMYINDLSSKGVKMIDFRKHISLSLAEEFPFEASLKDNLTMGNPDISDHKILEILKVVGLGDFLKDLPHGLETVLLPDGQRMSSTDAKKIILCRAILKQPQLIILEDALDQFSDSETKRIIDYLCEPTQPWAMVIVSSNAYWNAHATQTITLDRGQIS